MNTDLLPDAETYASAWPFPHAVVDGLWPADFLAAVLAEVPPAHDPRWRRFSNRLEAKLEGSSPAMWGPATGALADALQSPGVRDALTHMTGIADLVASFTGGGYHRIEPGGGRLGVHTDFNVHPDTGLYRRLNLLVYLNKDWPGGVGGELELWPERDGAPARLQSVDIEPVFNRTVVFTTSDHSWHGHPTPLAPTAPARLSFAAYYFTAAPPADVGPAHDTVFAET